MSDEDESMSEDYVRGLHTAWVECKDSLFFCDTEEEKNLVKGICNRIMAQAGIDIEKDPRAFRWDRGF